MRYALFLYVAMLIMAGCKRQNSAKTITATTDADEKLHPAELRLSGSAKVTCLLATGKNGAPAKCNVNGVSVAPPENVTATDKVYLLCEGTPPSTCTAKVQ